jgi:hypothetical protein
MPNLHHANDVIASSVSAGARIHPYSYLDKLEDKAPYSDIDSAVYIQPRN